LLGLWSYASADLIGVMATGRNAKTHGASIAEIETSVCAGSARCARSKALGGNEDRLIAVGKTNVGRPLFVAFTMRTRDGRRLIRPVSARYMHAKEIAAHEKESATPKKR
jgi:uncharacterized DUF497 family protein